jgi:hypothetical protein
MNLELTDEQTEALIRELSEIVQNDRLPSQSPYLDAEGHSWVATARAHTRAAAPLRHYEPPSKGRYKRR